MSGVRELGTAVVTPDDHILYTARGHSQLTRQLMKC